MYVREHESLTDLKRLDRKEREVSRSRRLRIIILAMEGWTAPAVAASVGLCRRECQNGCAATMKQDWPDWRICPAEGEANH